jgi:hypothetical protein
MNEGSGTALEDDGDGGDIDLAFGATTEVGPDWGTDGTHGDMLTFSATNEDYVENSAVSGLSGTQTGCVVAKFVAGSGARTFLEWVDKDSGNYRSKLVYQGDEDIESQSENTGAFITNSSTQDGTGGWDLVCIRWSDTISDWSLNGGAWDTASGTLTGLLAGIDRFVLGADRDSSPGAYFNGSMIAAWWWNASKSDAEIATIYNSGNPWPIIGVDTSSPPIFSVGPTLGAVTSTTAPTTFTLDQTGTVYGIMCTNGQTASVAQCKALTTCSGGASISSWTEAVVGGVSDAHTFTGLTAATIYDGFLCANATGGDSSSVSSLLDVTTSGGAAPGFSAGPTRSSITNGHNISGTVNANATVYAVWCNPGDGTPSVAEVKAGQCGGGNAAIVAANEAWLSGVGNDFNLSAANKPVRANVYALASNGSGDSSITSFLNQNRTADASQEILVLTSLSVLSPFGDATANSYFNPDVAIGDVIENDLVTSPGGYAVDIGTNGVTDIPDAAGDTAKQTFNYCIQDVSNTTTGEFTTPACWTTNDLFCINNGTPTLDVAPEDPVVMTLNVAISTIDLNAFINDVDADTLTYAVTAGTLPTGLSLNANGNITGTPTVENEAGATVQFTASDNCGTSVAVSLVFYPINTWTTPNIVGMANSSVASDAIIAAAPWRVASVGLVITGQTCSSEPVGEILTQNPAAAAQATALQDIEVTTAMNCSYTIIGGKSITAEGIWVTIWLADGTPTPGTAKIVNGAAVEPTGESYVANCPDAADISYFVKGTAVRTDGAICVSAGPVTHYSNGLGHTARGEQVVTLDTPQFIVGGLGINSLGMISVTDMT